MLPSLPPLPTISIPINLTPPASVLGTLSGLTSGLPTLPQPPAAVIQLFLQLLGALPPFPLPH